MEKKKLKEDLTKDEFVDLLSKTILKEFYLMPKSKRDEIVVLLYYQVISNAINSQIDKFFEELTK